MQSTQVLTSFNKRDLPISADYRPMFKIGLITLILNLVSVGNKASLLKLHIFIWALKSQRNMILVGDLMTTQSADSLITWGVEPAVNKALQFGVAEGLFVLKDDRYSLTVSGIAFAMTIMADPELFAREKFFLERIGKRGLTENFINTLTKKLQF